MLVNTSEHLDPAWAARLEAERPQLERSSTAERVAGVLRGRITDGMFRPGDRMPEDAIRTALGVSRNTLREAFRLLVHERLVVHELSRGVFVRILDSDDVVDLYRLRRTLECVAVRNVADAPHGVLERAAAAVDDGERAAATADWRAVGTANMRFHQAISDLAGSPRVSEIMQQLLAEMRLVFHVMGDPEKFHRPYLSRHREILEPLREQKAETAEKLLHDYLQDAEQQLVDAYRQRARTGG